MTTADMQRGTADMRSSTGIPAALTLASRALGLAWRAGAWHVGLRICLQAVQAALPVLMAWLIKAPRRSGCSGPAISSAIACSPNWGR